MKQTTARERVLKGIRNALIQKVENPFFYVNTIEPVYAPVDPVEEIAFAEALQRVGGSFVYCVDERELLMSLAGLMQERGWASIYCLNSSIAELLGLASLNVLTNPDHIDQMLVGITGCEALIGRTGSVLVSSVASDGRRMPVFPEVHLVLAYASQVVPDIQQALALMTTRYGEKIPSMMTFITGPSRTADIEKTLVMGAHGPKELIVFLIDDKNYPEIT
jgi:L-lactate dehydrogenase complex protein LldG